jgi:thioredoxin reductase (NADPH)
MTARRATGNVDESISAIWRVGRGAELLPPERNINPLIFLSSNVSGGMSHMPHSMTRDWCVILTWAVTGGGNSAGQAAIHLAKFARRVTLVVRASSLGKGMSDYLVKQIHALPNIEVRLGAEVIGGDGVTRLERVTVRDKARNVVESIPAELLFALIGATPRTDWLGGLLQRDAKGFIRTGRDVDFGTFPLSREPMSFETSVPGIFAIGDVRFGSTKRVATAVGEGAGAVQNIHQYIEEGLSAVYDERHSAPAMRVKVTA